MKKYFFSVACLCFCVGFVFTSCKKDDDGPETSSITSIIAKVEDGSSYSLDKVKGLFSIEGSMYEIVSGNYTNDGFTLYLPETIDVKYLRVFSDIPKGVKMSDPNTKLGALSVLGYKSNIALGNFEYEKETQSLHVEAEFIYADRDVTVTGSSIYEEGYKVVWNAALKKGWNIVYDIYTATEVTYTTSDPGGLKWYFYDGSEKLFQTESIAKFAGSKKLMSKGLE